MNLLKGKVIKSWVLQLKLLSEKRERERRWASISKWIRNLLKVCRDWSHIYWLHDLEFRRKLKWPRFAMLPRARISGLPVCEPCPGASGGLVDTQFPNWRALQRQIGCCGANRRSVRSCIVGKLRRRSVGAPKRGGFALPREIHASLARNCRLFKFRWLSGSVSPRAAPGPATFDPTNFPRIIHGCPR